MAACPGNNNFPDAGGERASPAQELHLQVYHLCILHHIRVLDNEIFMLQNNGSPSSVMLDEIEKTRAKRERIYIEFQRNLQQLQDVHNTDDNGSATGAQANK